MLEIGKATILSPGVKVSETDGSRHYGLNRYLIELGEDRFESDEFRETEVGEEIVFTDLTVFRKKNSLLTMEGGGNSISATVYEPPSTTFAPRIVPSEVVYSTSFGENPNEHAFETFGEPPSVTGEFLGHEQRDWLLPLMQNQNEHLHPDLNFIIDEGTQRHDCVDGPQWERQYSRRLLMTGAVVSTNIFGLNADDYIAIGARPEDGFVGKLMLGATIFSTSNKYDDPIITIFGATIADSDGLLRVQRAVDRDLPAEYYGEHTIPFALYALAELSIYSRFADGYIPVDFPIRALRHIDNYFGARITSPHAKYSFDGLEEFNERHGFDWHEIRAGLPKEAVQTEAERLYERYLQATLHGGE